MKKSFLVPWHNNLWHLISYISSIESSISSLPLGLLISTMATILLGALTFSFLLLWWISWLYFRDISPLFKECLTYDWRREMIMFACFMVGRPNISSYMDLSLTMLKFIYPRYIWGSSSILTSRAACLRRIGLPLVRPWGSYTRVQVLYFCIWSNALLNSVAYPFIV